LVRFHLFGIPLVSAIKDPITRHAQRLIPEDIKDYITEAVGLAELELGIDIFPKQYSEGQPYDQPAQNSFGYMILRHRPVESFQDLAVTSSDGIQVWDVPLAWVSTDYLRQGQINLVPFAVSAQSGTTIPLGAPVGAGLLPNFFRFTWVPALWRTTYTTGFKNGKIPRVVNQLIGTIAAMEILSNLASTYARQMGGSLGIDGLSQSSSSPGAQIFMPRLTDLAAKRKWLVGRIKSLYNLRIIVDNV
jgi:hypothetical protein